MSEDHPQVVVVSFGHLHGAPPSPADLVVDVRGWLPADPQVVGWCRPLTGEDPRVRRVVMAEPAAGPLVAYLYGMAAELVTARPDQPAVIAVGCAGGRHRSVVVADELAGMLRRAGIAAEVRHQHLTLPLAVRAVGD